jgi:predicted dithiol-disulfide oxidoreductase (DUF899 family)
MHSSAMAKGFFEPTLSTIAATSRWGNTWNYLDITALGRQELWGDSPAGYPQTPTYKWWNWHDNYNAGAAPDPKWVQISTAGEAAFRKRDA